jgi:hypothetical protein
MSDIAGQSADAAAGVSGEVANAAVGELNSGTPNASQSSEQGSEPGINPAWNELLQLIPSGLHSGVIPHLKKWDGNFQTRLHEVQSKYAPFEPYVDTPPETLEQAINFYKIMEENPQAVYNQMREFYGFGEESDQGQQGQADLGDGQVPEYDLDGDDILQHPKVQELLQNQEVIAQYFVQQQEAEQMAEFEQQIETEMAQITQANPDFDEDDQIMVYRIAAASNISLTEAANQVKEYSGKVAQRSAAPHAPSVMGASGVVPAAQNVDPTKLDGRGTRQLVADILNQAKQNG